MLKSRINLTLDADLVEFVKEYAESQRTTVSEVFTQFALKLKRVKDNDPTDIILADPDFTNSVLETTTRIKNGTIEWSGYDKVFE
jgi:16S rRNA G966 N2-methylase RsmD